MKVKFSVIPFVLAAIAMIFFRVMSVFGVDESGNFLGMDRMALSYTVIGIAIGLFVICVLINIFDRKTAPVYPVKKNFASGILAVLAGVSVIASSVFSLIKTTANSEYYMMAIISACFSVPAGIALALMSKVHFTGKSTVSGISILYIFPALWGCTELVFEFLNATKVSISATDLTGLFCYIFLTLYYFSHSMIVSRIKGRNPVKAAFIYGLPAVALSLSHGVYVFLTAYQEGISLAALLASVQFIILGLYALSFIIEMTANSYTKDELEIVDSLPDDATAEKEEKEYIDTHDYDDLVFSNSASVTDPHVDPADDYYSSAKGLDDFIMGFSSEDEGEAEKKPEKKSRKRSKKNEKPAPVEEAAPVAETEKTPEPEAETVSVPEPEPEVETASVPEPEPKFETVNIPEPATEPAPQPKAAPTAEESVPTAAKNETVEPAPAEIEKAVEDIMPRNVKTAEEKEAERLSEIDKLLKELDNKSE